MRLEDLTAEERLQLARVVLGLADIQRYGQSWDPDPATRARVRARWQAIADAFDPEPYGPERRATELAQREREAASDE